MRPISVHACLRDSRGGSPTAVLADDGTLTYDERCRIPVVTRASHAVFVAADTTASARLRFFTAEGELPACGHGTIAALAYLADRAGIVDDDFHVTLHVGARVIRGRASRRGDVVSAGFEAGAVALRPPTEDELSAVLAALGTTVTASDACVATLGSSRILVPVPDREAVAALKPDLEALANTCHHHGLLGCYVYTATPDSAGHHAARMFAPAIGVPEDIANANSTACLAAHLHAADPDHPGVTVDMGDSLGNPATIEARVVDDAGAPLVFVGGEARVVGPVEV